ncbi:PAS domain S-box protein [Aquimarina sp. AD1]|uniref:sensor histidine kinase n=1 Tax=Aquimarina sp. (strain AD1) TaxID=1714848 RepID=UPI000E4C9335|nr:ATP-binding protein [Aquimarina sp. AD1]AXT56792.1 PAS domain S-box protein [Aquimarina sp. AD1]RKN13308.1 PAS domain S-box protein [Aquimarina sp. AD1]
MGKLNADILQRALAREKAARKQAEGILEDKSRELYEVAQELKQVNEQLKGVLAKKSSELQGMFDNLVDAYVLMKVNGDVIEMNDAAKELFGYDVNKEKINVTSLIYKDDVHYAMESFQKLITKGSFTDYVARAVTKSNGVRTVHINGSVIRDKDNNAIAAQGIVRDITDQIEAEKLKEELLKNLEQSNKELNDFAHVVSHDLKSPLRSMNALINWLKEDYEDKLDENAVTSFNALLNKIEKMDHMIDGILSYSSIDRNEKVGKAVSLDKVVSDILEMIYVPETFRINIHDTLPTMIGDRFRFQQLFQNIISNAIKYNDKEKGILDIKCNDIGDFWEITLADNGPGIPEAYHRKIFEIFQTAQDKSKSTGIGLSIVKKIVNMYGGEVDVSSEENKGTTFLFTLKKPSK